MSDDTAPAGIDSAAVNAWLAEHVPGLRAPVTFELIAGGRSNLTYRVTDADGVARALRRPPTGGVLATAHDMSREWRFISAVSGTDVPVPEPLAYCADSTVTGAEFYVMGYVAGLVLADRDAAGELDELARRRAAEQTIDVLAALHQIEPRAVGLAGTAKQDGYLARQLRRWQRQVHQSGAPDLALLDEVHDALVAHIPEQRDGIVHGDYRPGNIAYGPDGHVLAVFDWELATLGDSLADLGWLLSTWEQEGDVVPPATPGPTAAPGFPGRTEVAERYARLTATEVSDLPYYVAFARWRSACIGAGVYARYRAGVMGDDGYLAQAREQSVRSQGEAARDAVRELGLLR
ncbi:aminoglycoside phosphotransferase (APT) family kinase protein [Tamaricihabitans halophyticus]|uniref:Aminoglycoside phosphotransferase (APT) family kinase protein n=1 Tax=Tamaricihabitans halophyticus TaxID=1262583 RepID=A0A4R2QMG8_9PSEU|nr:phosphotransferase family protein [Tamaricihabitans halophyticus]TCP50079.1 aminoglycoside phosphotransferase (APT) family kinase protein [Tamaricihabitans halophyticus]